MNYLFGQKLHALSPENSTRDPNSPFTFTRTSGGLLRASKNWNFEVVVTKTPDAENEMKEAKLKAEISFADALSGLTFSISGNKISGTIGEEAALEVFTWNPAKLGRGDIVARYQFKDPRFYNFDEDEYEELSAYEMSLFLGFGELRESGPQSYSVDVFFAVYERYTKVTFDFRIVPVSPPKARARRIL